MAGHVVDLGRYLPEIEEKAKKRNANHVSDGHGGVVSNNVKLNYDGLLGEYCFALFMELPTVDIRDDQPRGDGNVDFVVQGCSVEVKFHRITKPNGIWIPRREWNDRDTMIKSDVVVVAHPHKDKKNNQFVALRGWLDREACLACGEWRNHLGDGRENWFVPIDLLYPIEHLSRDIVFAVGWNGWYLYPDIYRSYIRKSAGR